ncbi:Uncharacterized protein PCOAH_00019820 [Plasmodium coatneyi]|uniref:Uncharacterized protein n=1 Tax=Plasmodium coatneyi TaxID=208452 RepID=A0A1B1DYV9_9APIC|nr:Uncharacterized protein PCOAH_00019820 [Plasmodium coatneyi]ANQ07777.1 Uncharacterized protein PCOAH_00019820 [Plasmodium coatneyi]
MYPFGGTSMDSNTCNYHRGINQGIARGYVSNENVRSVANYGNIRGEYNANPTSNFYLPTSGFTSMSSVSNTGQVNPTSNYPPCEHLLTSYACLEPSVSKAAPTSHMNTFNNIVAPYIGNLDKGNNLNSSRGFFGDYSSKGLTQTYDRSRAMSCVQCACLGRNADSEGGTLDAGLLNKVSGPFLGYGVYSASGGTHPSASANRASINISSVSHPPENANIFFNARENLSFNAGRTDGNAIAQRLNYGSGEGVSGSSQITNVGGVTGSGVSLPSSALPTHLLDANANAFQPVNERVRTNGESTTQPSNAAHNVYDYVTLNQVSSRQCTAPFNYPAINGCLLNCLNSNTGNSVTELNMRPTGNGNNTTSGSFPSDGNPIQSSAIGLSGGQNVDSAASVNPNRINTAMPTISIVSPHPSATTRTAYLTTPGMCMGAPIPCVTSSNIQMNNLTPGRGGLNLKRLGTYPEAPRPLNDVERKSIIYRNEVNRRNSTNEANACSYLRVNNEMVRTTCTGRNSHSYFRGSTNESVGSHAGRSSHTVYHASAPRTGGIPRRNEYREAYGRPPLEGDFLYTQNRKSYTQTSEAIDPRCYKEEKISGRTSRPMDRYTHLRERKILSKRSYDSFAHSANEPREKKGFSSFHYAPNVKRISTHVSSRGRNTLRMSASSVGDSDSDSDASGDDQVRRSYKEGRKSGRRGGRKSERRRENICSDTASSACSFSDDGGGSSESSSSSSFFTSTVSDKVKSKKKKKNKKQSANVNANKCASRSTKGRLAVPEPGKRKRPTVIEFLNAKWNRGSYNEEGRGGSGSECKSRSTGTNVDGGESCSLDSSGDFAKKRKKDPPGEKKKKRRNSNFEEAWKEVGASQRSNALSSNGDEKTRRSECTEGDSDGGESLPYSEEGMEVSGLVDTGGVAEVNSISCVGSGSGDSRSGGSRELHRKAIKNRTRKGKNGQGAISAKTKEAGGTKVNIKGAPKKSDDQRDEVDSEGGEEHIGNEDDKDEYDEKNDVSPEEVPKEDAGNSPTSDDHSGNDPSTDSEELYGSMSSSDESEKDGFHSADGASGEENIEVGEEEVEDSDGEVGEERPGEEVQKEEGAPSEGDTEVKRKKSKVEQANAVKREPNLSSENEQKDETVKSSSSAGCTSDTEMSDSETTSNYESAEESSEYLLDCSSDEITRTEGSCEGSGNSEVHAGGEMNPVKGAKDNVGSGIGNGVIGSAISGAIPEREPNTCASSILRVCSSGVKREKSTQEGEVKVIGGNGNEKENLFYREVQHPSGVKCFQTEWQSRNISSGGEPHRHNRTCIIKHHRRHVYTNMRSLDYIKTNEILKKIRKNVIKKKKINICEWIVLLSYLFCKKSRYLDFNKIYLYNAMKRLSPFLLKLSRRCNDTEIKSLSFYLSKVFILDDHFIFRVNIFFFNWFIFYVYKMKLKNVHFIEDLNLLINFFCGFLTNRRFLNYSLLFLINVVLQNGRGKCLYVGGNYRYVCSLYVSLFSKVVCLAGRHRGAWRRYRRGHLLATQGGKKTRNSHIKNEVLKWEVPKNEKCKLESRTDGVANQGDKTNVYTLSEGTIQNGQHAKSPTIGIHAPSKRQDLILLYVLYVSRNNFSIYVNLLKHILDDILKFKLTYNFHRVKIKSRTFYKKIIRCLKNVKKVMNRSGRKGKKRGGDNLTSQRDDHVNVNYSFVYLLIGLFMEYTSFSFTPSIVSFFQNEKLANLHRELISHLRDYTEVTFKYMKFFALDMMRVYGNIWLRNVFTSVNLKKMDGVDKLNGVHGEVDYADDCLSVVRGGDPNGWRRRRIGKRSLMSTEWTRKGGMSTIITATKTTVITLHAGCNSRREDGEPDEKSAVQVTQKDDLKRRSGAMDIPKGELQNRPACVQKEDPSHEGKDEYVPLDNCTEEKERMEHCKVVSFEGEGADEDSPDLPVRKRAKMKTPAKSEPPNGLQKSNKGNHYANESFVDATLFMLCRCLKVFKGSTTLSTLFDILFLSFMHRINGDQLKRFLVEMYTTDKELSGLVTKIIFRSDLRDECFRNVSFVNYFLGRREPLDLMHVHLGGLQVGLADVCAFYLGGFMRCGARNRSSHIGRTGRLGGQCHPLEGRPAGETNHLNAQLHVKPCPCMFLMYVLFFSRIFQNFKMYFMHFTRFSYSLQRRVMTGKQNIERVDARGTASRCLEWGAQHGYRCDYCERGAFSDGAIAEREAISKWEEDKWSGNGKGVMEKYHLISVEDGINMPPFKGMKRCSSVICMRANEKESAVIPTKLESVKIRENNSIGNNDLLFSERTAQHILSVLYEQRRMHDVQLGSIFARIDGCIFDGRLGGGRTKEKILNGRTPPCAIKERIRERYAKILSGVLKWNKHNIAYNRRKEEEKEKATLKRRRNKYTNIIIDVYPLIFLSLAKLLKATISINDDVKDKCFDVKNEEFPVQLLISVELNKNEEALKIHHTEIKSPGRSKWQYSFVRRCPCSGIPSCHAPSHGRSVRGKNPTSPSHHLGRTNCSLNLAIKLLYREIKTDFYILSEYYEEKVHMYRTLLILLVLKYLSSGFNLSSFRRRFVLFFTQRLFRLLCFRVMCLFLSDVHLSKLTSEVLIVDDNFLVKSYHAKRQRKRRRMEDHLGGGQLSPRRSRLFQKKSYNRYKRYSENFLFNVEFVNDGEVSEEVRTPRRRTVYKPFVPFGMIVMTKGEILKLKLQRKEDIKKDNLYINKCILKGKSKSKSKAGPEMGNQLPSEEKHSVHLSIVSIILLMNTLRKNSNYSCSINFYLSLFVDKFLEKKKYIHVDDQYLVHSYLVNLQNPLQLNGKKELFTMSEKNSWVRRKFELMNSGYKFFISSSRFPLFEFIFYEALKVYLTFLHKNALGALVCKMSTFNSMYAGMNRNLHFGIKINHLLCCKLNTLLMEEHLNMRLNKSPSSVTSILSACKFLFISMLDESENCELVVPVSGGCTTYGENTLMEETRPLHRVCLPGGGDDPVLGRQHMLVDQSNPSGGDSHGEGLNVANLLRVENGTNGHCDAPRRYNPNEKRSGRLVVGNCTRDYVNAAVGTLQRGEKTTSVWDNNGGCTEREGQITPQWGNSYRASHITIEHCTKYQIEHYHKDEGRNVPIKKKAAIYMKPNDVNKLITSFQLMNRTILDCTDFIYELYFSSERDDFPQEEKEKRNRHIYTWFESCLNVLTFERWVVHQLYNKFDNVSCIYTLKEERILSSHLVRINSHILSDIAKMQSYFEDRFDDVKKAFHADRIAKQEASEPICTEECASMLDATRESNSADVVGQLRNSEELAKPDELIEDYDELNSFIDFGGDISSGMLLQRTNARAVQGEVGEDVQRLNEYKVDEGWLTYIRSLI